MSTDSVKVRRSDWDRLWTGREAGFREGRYYFEYEYDGHGLYGYYSPPDILDGEDSGYDAICLEVAAIRDRATTDPVGPWVVLSRQDFDRLCELTRTADADLQRQMIRCLIPEYAEDRLTISVQDYNAVTDLAWLTVRDMPDDEPKKLDYRCALDRLTELNPDG